MKICPNCGYERTGKDDNFVSIEECPKCGIIYKKWEPFDKSKIPQSESVLKNDEILNPAERKISFPYITIIVFTLIFISLAIITKFIFFTKSETLRLVSTLPAVPPSGMESSSYLIHASGNEEAITAAGQIFQPPNQAPVLFKIGFYFTQYNIFKKTEDVKLQVILSEWFGDRPGRNALWVSEPTIIRSTNKDYNIEWLDFDVPRVTLSPGRMYIAWVTLSSLSNQNDASVGIVRMGPRYSQQGSEGSPYPQGMCTLYRQANPDGDVSQMINSSWEVNDYGHNLHFKMSFENGKSEHDKEDESQKRIKEIIEQKTKRAIEQKKEKDKQKQIDIRQQEVNMEIWRQEDMKQRQYEMEQRKEEMKRQNDEREEERKKQLVEMEIWQYERQQQQNEYNKLNKESGSIQRRYRRR